MSDQTPTEVDPMSQAAANLEAPKYPTLAPDRVEDFKLLKAVVEAVKGKPGRKLLTMTFVTMADLPDSDGRTLHKGFKVFNRIALTPTDGSDDKRPRTIGQIAAELGQVLKWCGLNDKTPQDLVNNPTIIEGYVGKCRIGLSKESGDFPASSTVKLVLPG